MRLNRMFLLFSLIVLLIASLKIMVHLGFWVIPAVLFFTGFGAGFYDRSKALYLFFFLFPFINASPELTGTGYPFNYLAPALFLLAGMMTAVFLKREPNQVMDGNDDPTKNEPEPIPLDRGFSYYYLFLVVLFVSAVFVVLRWSNMATGGSIWAIGADTPVAPPIPGHELTQRVSFATIFPVSSLLIYFIAPFIFFYIKAQKVRETPVFTWLSYGFYISVGLALVQKASGRSFISDRLGKELTQFYGGFSDFNAFGFFSGAMFLWSTYAIKNKNPLGYVTFCVALVGGILSGSRTVFFFIAAGMAHLGYNALKTHAKNQKKVVAALLAIAVLFLVFAGGTLVKRLGEGFSEDQSLYDKLNAVTNGRLWMTLFTLETIGNHYESGVGTGNFTFYLSYKNYLPYKSSGERYTYDLTLNHYLLVFAENGVLGFLFFTAFMVFIYRRSQKKLLMGTILFALLFNNFFWFPEAFLLFWVLAALDADTAAREERKKPGRFEFLTHNKRALAIAASLVMTFFMIDGFSLMHPKTWAKELDYRYDYGFWYPEKNELGDEFRWTSGERAGLYLTLDNQGRSQGIKLVCGAPLRHLKGNKQKVEVYWKGEIYKEFLFSGNGEHEFRIEGSSGEEGFMELRVRPYFNLEKLGLGPETRDLGVQVFLSP